MSSLYSTMLNRALIVFNTINVIFVQLCCAFRGRSLKTRKDLKLLRKGKRRLFQDLDIMRIMTTVNNYDILFRVLFSRNERLLLNFQKRNVLESDSKSSSSGINEDPDQSAVNKMITECDEDQTHNQRVKVRLQKYLQDLGSREMEPLERRLLTGIWESKTRNIELAIEEATPLFQSF